MEVLIRAASFATVLALLWVRERRVPAFRPPTPAAGRTVANVALATLGAITARLVAPAGAAGAALHAERQGLGLFNVLDVSPVLAGVVGIVVLDCVVYWQHRAFHRVAWLWPLHAVHHADPHVDVTTAVRFHPLEILLSLLLKASIVLALGVPAWATVAFESLLAAAALFNHANTRFAPRVERALRRVVVTPDLHRVHHATVRACRDRNFGFSVSAWDRAFGTYLEPEDVGVPIERFGLAGVESHEARSLGSMLWLHRRVRG